MNLYNTQQIVKPNRGLVGRLLFQGSLNLHGDYLEMRNSGPKEGEPHSRLAMAILAQAFRDALTAPPQKRWTRSDVRQDREDAIQFLRAMSGEDYQDRLMWLGIAYPSSKASDMDRILQLRLDGRGLPKV